MKPFVILLVLFHFILQGCGSADNDKTLDVNSPEIESEVNQILSLPETIELSFQLLELDELPIEAPQPEWRLAASIPFGKVNQENVMLTIFEESSSNDSLPKQINGILRINGDAYVIRDLTPEFVNHDQVDCSQACVYQRFFSDQSQYELIGSIGMAANGSGRKLFVVYDGSSNKLKSFESWGEAAFLDLDHDGRDEFVIQFPGLHLSFPDVSVIRTNQGKLEISSSVFSSLQRNQGDFAQLITDRKQPLISIANVQDENQSFYYSYQRGALQKTTEQIEHTGGQ